MTCHGKKIKNIANKAICEYGGIMQPSYKRTLLKIVLTIIICILIYGVYYGEKDENTTDKTLSQTINIENIINEITKPVEKTEEIVVEEIFYEGWVTASELNVRNEPFESSEIIGHLLFNDNITYTEESPDWVKIKYQDKDAYISKKYISDKEAKYTSYSVPANRGFKSYMGYKTLTNKSSWQYKLQQSYAITGNYGIRMVNNRYCIAVGSHFQTSIGQYLDLVLENGTIIPCIMADLKADIHTDNSNIVTLHNGCVSEFVIDKDMLHRTAKKMGDISYCNDTWKSPVVEIRVYDKNIFN